MTTLGGTPTLVGLPYDASSSYQRGPAEAPAAIREALWSPSANAWSELGVNIGAEGAITDAGDLELAGCSAANARRTIEHGIARLLAMGARPVSLGGDHSVTYPVLRAVRPHAPSLTILHVMRMRICTMSSMGTATARVPVRADHGGQSWPTGSCRWALNADWAPARSGSAVRVEVEMRSIRGDLRVPLDMPVYVSIDVDALDLCLRARVPHRSRAGCRCVSCCRCCRGSRHRSAATSSRSTAE
jgi:hypothetical protein